METTPRLNARLKLGYGLGQFGWAAKDVCFHYFLFFYYTQFLGLSASLAGLAALLALVADGISDPIIGQVSDNWRRGKWGRRHPLMAMALLPFIAALIAIFNPPPGLEQSSLFAWYLVMAIAVRTFLTLYTVPHMALGAELSEDYQERTSISVYRNAFGYVGGLLIQVAAWFVVIPTATEAGNTAQGYSNVGIVAALIATFGMTIAFFSTRSRIPYLVRTSVEQQSRPWYTAFIDILSVFQHPSAVVLLGASLILSTVIGIGNTMLLHVNSYLYGFSSEQIGVFMLTIFFALLPSSALALWGSRRWGKRRAVIVFIIASCLLHPVAPLMHLYGLSPTTGSLALVAFVCFFVVLQQCFSIAILHTSGAMLPDVVDEMELTTRLRQEGMLNSAMMLTQKVTFGLGTFCAGLAIDYAGFAGVTHAADTTPEMLTRLVWVYGPGIALLKLAGAAAFLRYNLSEPRCKSIQAQLMERRSKTPA